MFCFALNLQNGYFILIGLNLQYFCFEFILFFYKLFIEFVMDLDGICDEFGNASNYEINNAGGDNGNCNCTRAVNSHTAQPHYAKHATAEKNVLKNMCNP